MKKQLALLFACNVILPMCVFAQQPDPLQYPFGAPGTEARGVFGEDDRKEVKDAEGFQDFVRATAVMVSKDAYSNGKYYSYSLRDRLSYIFGTKNFDSDVRFLDQPALANCTGFLIAPDILVTAGHCIENLEDAQNYVWIFDYTSDLGFNNETGEITVDSKNVYYVSEVYDAILDDETEVDYAVLKLSKKSERLPYRFRTSGTVSNNSYVNTIGSPTGLPLKFSGNAFVVDNSHSKWFKTNIDAFPGNSGGPVFDQNGFLEGILVRGAIEYDYSRGEYTGDYIYDSNCDCIKTVAFEDTAFNAGCQIHKITDIPYNLKLLAIYENIKYAIENKSQSRFDQWASYNWIFTKEYTPSNQEPLLKVAAEHQYMYAVEKIFETVKDELTEQDGRNLLDLAYSSGNKTMFKFFLDNGIYPDVLGSSVFPLLYTSVMDGNLDYTKLLVDAGADIHIQNAWSNNLLHLVAAKGNQAMATYLISVGVSPSAKNHDGDLPEKVAKNAKHKDLSKYLKTQRKLKS